jgi:hypothetical protein
MSDEHRFADRALRSRRPCQACSPFGGPAAHKGFGDNCDFSRRRSDRRQLRDDRDRQRNLGRESGRDRAKRGERQLESLSGEEHQEEHVRIAAITNPDRKEEFDKQARRYESEQDEPSNEAKKFANQSKKSLENSTAHETRHHHLTIAVTVLHVSIAIATISIIMPKTMRWRHAPWFASMALGAFGAIIAVAAYAR